MSTLFISHSCHGETDNVLAAEHLAFADFNAKPVRVTGWPDEPGDQEKEAWVKTYSDHALLYFEVQKV